MHLSPKMNKSVMNNLLMRALTGAIYLIIFWGIFLWAPSIYFSALIALFGLIIFIGEWKNFYNPRTPLFWFSFMLYPTVPMLAIIHLNQIPQFHFVLAISFVVAFCYDICAYIIGISLGTHKLLPRISPNKTWEGLVGGCIGALAGVYLLLYAHNGKWAQSGTIVAVLLLCASACAGDLFESYLKRRTGIKDASGLMPGHGGLLDRLDSILGTGLCAWCARDLFLYLLR